MTGFGDKSILSALAFPGGAVLLIRKLVFKEIDMARLLDTRKVASVAMRFQILWGDVETLKMEVLDTSTKTIYTIQAAGKVEYRTMMTASQERWIQIIKSIEG